MLITPSIKEHQLDTNQLRHQLGTNHHLPVEIEFKAWWAIKKLNMDLTKAGLKRSLDLNELEELRYDAYLNSKIAKEKLKR